MTLTPAERYAALKTLETAVKAVAADAGQAAIQHGSDTGADRWRTRYGTVVIATRKDTAAVGDDAELVAWVKRHAPSEIVESVRPAYIKAVLDSAIIDGDNVIDPTTGEALPWAIVKQGIVYASTPRSEAKDRAVTAWDTLLRDRLATIEPSTIPSIEGDTA